MRSPLRYLTFGLLVLVSYWITVHNGIVFFRGDGEASSPAARAGGAIGRRPSVWSTGWSTGYQGGK